MRLHFRAIATVAALAAVLGAGVLPAAADDWDDGYRGWGHHGWGHGGWGHEGWGDGDWDHDGWRRGGWGHGRGWGYRPGWGYRSGWNNGGAAAAALGGFALGTVAGVAAQPGYYGGCYVTRRPVADYWGNVVGYRSVQVCE